MPEAEAAVKVNFRRKHQPLWKCRDCGGQAALARAFINRARSPRCLGCGGILDPLAPLFTACSPRRAPKPRPQPT